MPAHDESEWTDVGSLEDFPTGSSTAIRVGERRLGLINSEGALFALGDRCPHMGGPIASAGRVSGTFVPSDVGTFEYGMSGCVIKCPWHRWEFDLMTGTPLFGTSKVRLAVHDVEVHGDRVLVRNEQRRRQPAQPAGATVPRSA